MKNSEKIRGEVSKAYEQIVKKEGSCCCGGQAQSKGVVTQSAGYSPEELAALPADAVTNSFGCGNPVAFSGVCGGDTVLDLGAGAGIDVILAAKKVGPMGRSIGIDMTDEMLSRAQKNIKEAGFSNAEVRKGVIEELPVDSESVDWVISNCVINLSPEKEKVFAEIYRVLKPGGRMLVSDIVAESLPEWVKKNQALYASCISGAIPEKAYVEGLQKAGFSKVEVQGRLVYEASQLRGFLLSEITDEEKKDDGKFVDDVATSLTGKVWSARVFAQK